MLRAARWKCRTQKIAKKSPSGHHRTTLSGYIFATKARIDNRKKNLLSSNISSTCPKHGELWPTSGLDRSGSLEHPCKFQRVSRLDSVTARHSSGRQPNFAALNRGRHLYSAGRLSRWALPTFLVLGILHACFMPRPTILLDYSLRSNGNTKPKTFGNWHDRRG